MNEATYGPALGLLQGFSLNVDRQRVPLVWSAQRLLAFLALKNHSLSRTYVAGALWPETTALKANANLRTSLWRVQRTGCELIDSSSQQLTLTPAVCVDVRRAEESAYRLLDPRAACDDLLTSTTRADLAADLLPDWYDDDWLLLERERFHQLRLHALEAMCKRLTAGGQYGEAVDTGMAAVRAEPLRESAHEALIKAHLAAGNRWEAVRQFERCRLHLLAEMGLEPAAKLRDLLLLEQTRLRAEHVGG